MDYAGVGLHEAPGDLHPQTLELHWALRSLIEELGAVDWYTQGIDATRGEALKAVLSHGPVLEEVSWRSKLRRFPTRRMRSRRT
jgi:hypothetical protein